MNKREKRRQIAEDTLDILSKGCYINAKGDRIVISEAQKRAESGTMVYSPTQSDQLLATRIKGVSKLPTEIVVNSKTSLDAVRMLLDESKEKVLCLNFASARNAGGGFLGGSQAQEESIARATGLYNCQLLASEYYTTNRQVKSCIYTDYMIYSPEVPILKQEDGTLETELRTCGIITAPAVNMGVVKNREPERVGEVAQIMKRRIQKVLAIALFHGYKRIVLGAWGCGVFQNSPEDMAAYFYEVLEGEFKNEFHQVVFAIYSNNERFIRPFREKFA